jgi:hypothetical protein
MVGIEVPPGAPDEAPIFYLGVPDGSTKIERVTAHQFDWSANLLPLFAMQLLLEKFDLGSRCCHGYREVYISPDKFFSIFEFDYDSGEHSLDECVNWSANKQGDCGGRVEWVIGVGVICENCRNR